MARTVMSDASFRWLLVTQLYRFEYKLVLNYHTNTEHTFTATPHCELNVTALDHDRDVIYHN